MSQRDEIDELFELASEAGRARYGRDALVVVGECDRIRRRDAEHRWTARIIGDGVAQATAYGATAGSALRGLLRAMVGTVKKVAESDQQMLARAHRLGVH